MDINLLPPAVALTGAEFLPGVQSGTKKITTQQIANFLAATSSVGVKMYGTTAAAIADGTLVNNSYFTTPGTGAATAAILYQKVSGVANAITRFAGPALPLIPMVLAGGSNANDVAFSAPVDYVVTGTTQVFVWTANAPNNGNMTLLVPGINGGVAAPLVLPDGQEVPVSTTRTNYTAAARWVSSTSKFELIFPVFQQQHTHLLCNAAAGSDGRTLVFDLAFAGYELPASYEDIEFVGRVPGDLTIDAATITIRNKAGSILWGPANLRDLDGSSTVKAGRWFGGDTIRLRRQKTGEPVPNHARLIEVHTRNATPAETVAGTDDNRAATPAGVAAALQAQKESILKILHLQENELVTDLRRVRAYMPESTRLIVAVKPSISDYRDGYVPSYTDQVVFEFRDLKDTYTVGLTTSLWALNSVHTRFGDILVPHINYTWDRLAGASSTAGQIFSVFEPVVAGGMAGDTAAAIMALSYAGPGHANIDATVNLFVVTGAYKNGFAIADGVTTMKAGDYITCTQFDIQSTWLYKGPGAVTFMTNTGLRRLGGTRQLTNSFSLAFATNAVVAAGYGLMVCHRNANRMQARDTGDTVGTLRYVNFNDNHQELFPNAKRIMAWNSNTPGHCLEDERPATYQPFRRNGSQVPYTSDLTMFSTDEPSGSKIRQPVWVGATDLDSESGNTVALYNYLSGVRANAA